MGKLIKSHLARLVTLSAAGCKYEYHVFKVNITSSPKSLPRTDQFLAAIIGFFNPKILFDFATKSRSQAGPIFAGHQSYNECSHLGLGMAAKPHCWVFFASQHYYPSDNLSSRSSPCGVDVSIY